MLRNPTVRKIILLWLVWWVCLFAYQAFIIRRFQPQRPDTALQWTATETRPRAQNNKPYLLDPFLNEHVSWDSEFYLGIADAGYDNAQIRSIPGPDGRPLSLSYAFFPLYGWLARLLAMPLALLGLGRIATLTLAALILSLLGTLGGMLALYDLARGWLGEDGGLRAAWYMLIFPTAFFFGQVYTEGLFVGLAFGALAMMRREKWAWAALLSALAVWTRAVGIALAVPLALAAGQHILATRAGARPWKTGLEALAATLAPMLALGAWWVSPLRPAFWYVEDHFFSRAFLAVERSFSGWKQVWQIMANSHNAPTQMYFLLEFAILFLALACSLALLRRMPAVALFSLAVFAISFFSGAGQSMNRYVLAAPAVFLGLARLGENDVFDHGWTLASILWMGTLAALFSFDLWVG